MWVLSDSVIFISSPPFSRFSLKCHGPVFSCIHTWLAEGQHWHGGVKVKVQLALLTTCRAEEEDSITERWLFGQKKVCKMTTVKSHPNTQNYWEREDTQNFVFWLSNCTLRITTSSRKRQPSWKPLQSGWLLFTGTHFHNSVWSGSVTHFSCPHK